MRTHKQFHTKSISDRDLTQRPVSFLNSPTYSTQILNHYLLIWRWSLNLVLRCVDQVLMCNSTIDSEDLVEVNASFNSYSSIISNKKGNLSFFSSQAEPQSICAFFCYLFMMFYKFKQCRAVTNRYVSVLSNYAHLFHLL